jgi:hypothetical protein
LIDKGGWFAQFAHALDEEDIVEEDEVEEEDESEDQ